MKILWVSNAPYVASGYGVQTQVFTRLLKDAGHKVVVFGMFGHQGATMGAGGIDILPGGLTQYGEDMIALHVEHYKPDVTVLLYDVWVYQAATLKLLTTWAPVDHDPLPPAVERGLRAAKHVWSMSRFGETQMRAAGIASSYVPHGVDRTAYKPVNRAEARRAWNIPEDAFVAMMCAANRGFPSRKSIDKVLKAWGRFIQTHPDAKLYLHTFPDAAADGIDVLQCAAFYGVSRDNLLLPDVYRMLRGDYSPERVNMLYNAADVLLAPSMGEGFGLPVIEAQAAGCPVIVTDFSAQSELVGPGYKIPVDPLDDYEYTLQGAEMARVKPSQIVTALEWALEQRGNEVLRKRSQEFAADYDADTVFQQYMQPALEQIADTNRQADMLEAARQARTAARLQLRNPVMPPIVEEIADAAAAD